VFFHSSVQCGCHPPGAKESPAQYGPGPGCPKQSTALAPYVACERLRPRRSAVPSPPGVPGFAGYWRPSSPQRPHLSSPRGAASAADLSTPRRYPSPANPAPTAMPTLEAARLGDWRLSCHANPPPSVRLVGRPQRGHCPKAAEERTWFRSSSSRLTSFNGATARRPWKT
jgi:hypothetical protein